MIDYRSLQCYPKKIEGYLLYYETDVTPRGKLFGVARCF